MFTGIIEEIGTVGQVIPNDEGQEIEIYCTGILSDLALGDSISCNGVCLSVTAMHSKGFRVYTVLETLSRTTLQNWVKGSFINLERAMLPTTRLGGHWVSGHIDGVGTVENIKCLKDESKVLTIHLPEKFMHYCISKGSVTLNGVSLTIASLKTNHIQVALIPITLEKTNLSCLQKGDFINVEVDLLGKYVERLLGKSS